MRTLFLTKIKCLCRDREGMFWALVFPLLLALIYYYAFAGLGQTDVLRTIDIAAVSTGSSNEETLGQTLRDVTFENGLPIFNVVFVEQAEAEKLLDNNEITGYIMMAQEPELVVKNSDIKATITRNVLSSYRQMYAVSDLIVNEGNAIDYSTLSNDMNQREYYLSDRTDGSGSGMDYTVIYFYALLALVCVYGGNWGLREGVAISASLSTKGARIHASPYNTAKLLFCNLFASFVLHFSGVLVVVAFMMQILKIDFGTRLPYVIGVCVLGTIIGILFGCLVALYLKGTEKKKDAFLTGITLIWGFLAGLMVPSVKYMVASRVPFLTYINPIHLITDCLYSLYYYGDLSRYLNNMVLLAAMAVVLAGANIFYIGRHKHGSI